MMTVKELEKAVTELSKEDLADFRRWYREFDAERWDEELERDVAAGKLDWLLEEAKADVAAGRVTPR
jgi:hypothetical protein